MKKLCILLALSALFLFSSCSGRPPERLPLPAESEEGDKYILNSEKAAEIIKTLTESGERYPSGSNMYSSQDSFMIENILYINAGFQNINLVSQPRLGGLFEVNPTTGKAEPICRDPLCKHKSAPECPMIEYLAEYVTDGKSAFFLNNFSINRIDLREGKRIPVYQWEYHRERGPYDMICCDGYLYFVARISDTADEIYRIPVTGGEPERLSHLDEHIINFTVSDGYVFWTNTVWTLKCAPLDFSEVTVLGEKITTLTSGNDRLFYYDRDDCIHEMDISTKNTKVVAENAAGYQALLCDGELYYTKQDFQKTKQIFCYHADTGETTSTTLEPDIIRFNTGYFSFDSDTVIFYDDVENLKIYGAYGDYLLVYMFDRTLDPTYSYELWRYFFLKKDGTEMAEIFFEDFRDGA